MLLKSLCCVMALLTAIGLIAVRIQGRSDRR
jgi:hypothetical protein